MFPHDEKSPEDRYWRKRKVKNPFIGMQQHNTNPTLSSNPELSSVPGPDIKDHSGISEIQLIDSQIISSQGKHEQAKKDNYKLSKAYNKNSDRMLDGHLNSLLTAQTNSDLEFSHPVDSFVSSIEETVIHNTPRKNQAFCQNTFKTTQDEAKVNNSSSKNKASSRIKHKSSSELNQELDKATNENLLTVSVMVHAEHDASINPLQQNITATQNPSQITNSEDIEVSSQQSVDVFEDCVENELELKVDTTNPNESQRPTITSEAASIEMNKEEKTTSATVKTTTERRKSFSARSQSLTHPKRRSSLGSVGGLKANDNSSFKAKKKDSLNQIKAIKTTRLTRSQSLSKSKTLKAPSPTQGLLTDFRKKKDAN